MLASKIDQQQQNLEALVTSLDEILGLVVQFDPKKYGASRNFKNGAVSRLSPYISRDVISTLFVYEHLTDIFEDLRPFEKFIQELAWRDYWQRVWQENNIDVELKTKQSPVLNSGVPKAILEANTGIEAVDNAIQELYETGYMHNHMRMYVAAIVCNIGKYHWKEPALWLYSHLHDGDWGSNALSWQWVAGSNSHKKYYANQENINKYFDSDQKNTFLDCSYEALVEMNVPDVLTESTPFEFKTELPKSNLNLRADKPVLFYTTYNLDPFWRKDMDANRVLILEPEQFEKYPVSQKSLDFILDLSKNIPDLQIFSGSFQDFSEHISQPIFFKEHPLNTHFAGTKDSRDWLNPEVELQSSFFKYWKKVKKSLPEFA